MPAQGNQGGRRTRIWRRLDLGGIKCELRYSIGASTVWAAEGKSAATLNQFFVALGPERCAKLEAVTIDMSVAYIKAVSEATPEAKIIFDPFHIQCKAHDALDEVRREEIREAEPEDKKALKNIR